MIDEYFSRMSVGSRPADQRIHLLQEIRNQNFDTIKYSSYRTACKLRFIQKKTHLHSIDIWNMIEAFRDSGLNTLEHHAEVNIARLEALISSLYHNLNKRLPSQQQVSVEAQSSLLLNWLLSAYTAETSGRVRVLSIKVALALMCAGKFMDKLRYIFSQICDSNGLMVLWKFSEYLQEALALPAAVYESPNFPYSHELASEIFPPNSRVTLNNFIDTMMAESGPSCLVWLPVLHRLVVVENVVHPTCCDICQQQNFSGFRYRCHKCHNFEMCQDCFWRGRTTGGHTLDHEVKEYTTYKSPSKQIGHTLRKSFRCVPDKGKSNIPRFPEDVEKPINLSHIVPPSPLPTHNGFPEPSGSNQYDYNSLDSRSSTARSGGKFSTSFDSSFIDDEHKLIARYCARLAAEVDSTARTTSEGSLPLDSSRAQRELIFQLENRNREITREIAKIKKQQENNEYAGPLEEDPALVNELRALRQRKQDLESMLTRLQESRKNLMVQLEGLMRSLKNHQASPRSTPNSSPRSAKSPPPSRSAPPTPGSSASAALASIDSLTGDVKSAFSGGSSVMTAGSGNQSSIINNSSTTTTALGSRNFRSDLLVAADSVTNAMSTLVRELNSDGSDEEESTAANIVLPLGRYDRE